MNIVIPATFDCFHKGHKKLLDYAWLMCGKTKMTIIVNGDNLCATNGKDIRDASPIRVVRIKSYLKSKGMKADIETIEYKEGSVQIAILKAPCFWLTGTDWNLKDTSERNNVPESFWEENEIYLVYKDREPDVSSTKIRRLLI